MSTPHVPLERVQAIREERKSSRRRFLGTAAASALAVSVLRFPKARPAGAQQFTADQSASFYNPNPIGIPDNSNAVPYGAPLVVSGMVGTIQDISVAIYGFRHGSPEDVEIMLENPTSIAKVIMAGVGGAFPVAGADLAIADSAAIFMPDNALLVTGNYKPTNHLEIGPDPGTSFGSPAPEPVVGENFQVFHSRFGASLNGTWRLWVRDNAANQIFGGIDGGWALGILTDARDPVARNDSYVVNAGETLTVRAPGVLRNDDSRGGGRLRLLKPVRKNTRLGRLTVNRNGALRFVANENVEGRQRANYKVTTGAGLTARARITITVRDPEPRRRRRRRRR